MQSGVSNIAKPSCQLCASVTSFEKEKKREKKRPPLVGHGHLVWGGGSELGRTVSLFTWLVELVSFLLPGRALYQNIDGCVTAKSMLSERVVAWADQR